MKFRTRLLVAAAVVAVCFVAAFWFAHHMARNSNHALLGELARQQHTHFLSAVHLQGTGFETLVARHARNDGTVAFLGRPDPDWATRNINQLVGPPDGGDALWVLDASLRTIHAIDADFRRLRLPVTDLEVLRKHIGEQPAFQFFGVLGGELWQFFGAAIIPAGAEPADTIAQGYLLLGKRWDEAWVARLATVAGLHLEVETKDLAPPPASYASARGYLRRFRHEVTGLGDETIAVVRGRVDLSRFSRFSDDDNLRLLFLAAWGALTLLGIAAFAAFAVLQPLSRIARSLEANDPLAIAELQQEQNVFGKVARQLIGHHRRERAQQEEMRRKVDRAATGRTEAMPVSNEAWQRLAAQLQDGALPALTAAGRQLAEFEADISAKRAVELERLAEVRESLARIAEGLRELLLDLGPEELGEQDFGTALRLFEKRLWTIAACRFSLEYDARSFTGLPRESQQALYGLCRELAGNALRHARPTRAALSLVLRANTLHLVWANDGVTGPAAAAAGRGLRAIQQRVLALEGTCRGDATEDTWQIEIEVPYTNLVRTTG